MRVTLKSTYAWNGTKFIEFLHYLVRIYSTANWDSFRELKRVFQAMFMVLATVMLLSIPVSTASSKTVATIGSKSYTSLASAVKKVKKGQTIKLKLVIAAY